MSVWNRFCCMCDSIRGRKHGLPSLHTLNRLSSTFRELPCNVGRKVKVKVSRTTPWWRMWERRCSSTILNLGTRWRWVVSSTPRLVDPLYSFDRLDGSEIRSGHWSYLCRQSSPGRAARSSLQYRLSYPSSKVWWKCEIIYFLKGCDGVI
jgi:hypothetical protein